MASSKPKVPVTVLTGFLGSGKTTLLNNILKDNTHGLRFAIIENEFGEVGVDEKLISGGPKTDISEEVIEVMNGCICCTVRGDLVEALKRLYSKVSQFDAVLIETTGMADPAPVAQTFFVNEEIQEKYQLDGIVTVVDAAHIAQHLDKEVAEGAENESVEQIAFADRVILNKCDLLDSGAHLLKGNDDAMDTSEDNVACTDTNNGTMIGYNKDSNAKNNSTLDKQKTLDDVIRRIKEINSQVPIIQTSYSKVDPKQLLNIGAFNLDRVLEMDPEFLASDGTDHVHDTSVSSVAFSFPGLELNVNKLNMFISELIQSMSQDLYRYKGVIAVKGMREKFVFQGVHMLFSGGFIDENLVWKDNEERECRFVFIGKNVKQNHAAKLKQGFLSCEAEKELRFKIGEFCQARVTGGWKKAKVLKQWDDGNPYRLEVQDDNKTNVYGPIDKDFCVKELPAGM